MRLRARQTSNNVCQGSLAKLATLHTGVGQETMNAMYPSEIPGFRFLQRRELEPVSICWDFEITADFSRESARQLFAALPDDLEISYLDTDTLRPREEAYSFIRHEGGRYYAMMAIRGGSQEWFEREEENVVQSFMSSPLVKEPLTSFASFTVATIANHQRNDHRKEQEAQQNRRGYRREAAPQPHD